MFTINQILFIMWMRLLSLCGLAILLPACGGTGTSGTASDSIFPKEGDVKMLTTTTTKSFDLAASSLSFGERGEASPQTIRINTALTYQPIDGFGAAITGSTAYNLLKMDAADRDAFLRKTFSPTEGYGFSYVRVCIGCSDFSLSEYTCCDTEGIEHFALTAEETDYVIPVLKEILAINPELKMNRHGIGKYLLRKAFDDGTGWLPDSILYRQKAAFSDAVGHSLVDDLKQYADQLYAGRDWQAMCLSYPEEGRPFTTESLLYRTIFEKYYPGQGQMIPAFWMPNSSWPGCNVNDPSARVLSNYGESGK